MEIKESDINIKSTISLVVAALVSSSSVNAALLERLGGQAYYDDVANLTWLADANAGAGSVFDDGWTTTDGYMTWDAANNWVAGLDVAGVSGWRLPDQDTCAGFNCSDNEMGNLFYNVLGGSANSSIVATHNANYDLFSNVQSYVYWSATERSVDPAWALVFFMDLGYQNSRLKDDFYFAWAVHSGDVSAVPAPAALWLFGSGLLCLIGMVRCKA
ncbi:MAG: DUF1566 domain-containing protein [Oceanicoccus sp.]|uniref:Lcl domain-containing protein n=1 Tax=Oceanicoccus sp. TaxID=2691044 RepID=UPI00260CFCD5|nr:DUF1566 domain-containing protein [Oceanicoccus sp.]MCP3906624.1 DUF1566 domain-containing protein [Oceanicoccus sp.]